MAAVIKEFDSVSIANASIQFKEKGTQQEGEKFGCIGQLESETEIIEIIKMCAGVEVKKVSKPQKATVTVSAHVPVAVFRKFYGVKNEGLKPGVYAYGTKSKGLDFVFTADVVDEFEDVTKLIAFANCATASGLKFTIENGAEEVALLEFEFTALPDEEKEIYYEALIPELEDDSVAEQWHTMFNRELVEAGTP